MAEFKRKTCEELLEGLTYEVLCGEISQEITDLVYNSNAVTKDCIFVCIKGANFDAHDKATEVAQNGAKAIVVSHDIEIPKDLDVTVIKVDDTRYALAFISAAFFDHPASQLKVIGVTGTKGKTTTTYLVKSILEHAGYRVGLVGTIEAIIGDVHIPANNTTPESYVLQQYFRQMANAGCDVVVMEVSSQGLMQHRTQGFTFELGIFTNLEPDHIGPNEHKDFEDYMHCKGLLFKQCKKGIVNFDDAHWKQVVEGHTCELETYGFSSEADLYAEDVHLLKGEGYLGVDFKVKGYLDFEVEFHAPGRFSVYNALTAIAICHHFGVSVEEIKKHALSLGSKVIEMELLSQFRCNGSNGYLAWLDNTLQISETANYDLEDIDYDFRVFDDPNDLYKEIKERNKVHTTDVHLRMGSICSKKL